jgi:hypothetical protein
MVLRQVGQVGTPASPVPDDSRFVRREIPVEDLCAIPVQHALEALDIVVDRLEILDAVRLAADPDLRLGYWARQNRSGTIVVALHGGCVMLLRNREGKQVATITEWLASLGLPEYAQLFADNSIDDVSILRDLTDQDLKDVGVPLGHRRKMLRAIAELSSAVPAGPQPSGQKNRYARFWRAAKLRMSDC